MTNAALSILANLLGEERVSTNPADLTYYVTDIAGEGPNTPLCAVRPQNVDALCQAIQIATGMNLAVIPRGSGLSYTGGYQPKTSDAVLFDLTDINDIVEINEADRYVTVEAGCTWGKLYNSLAEQGLRTPAFGPLSGSESTVGGLISNNGGFFGNGAYGAIADSVLSLDVVLADGSLVETGSAIAEGRVPFFRHFGPDLTGLFIGDTGAFGIKARITIKLIAMPAAENHLSFAYKSIEDTVEIQSSLARDNVCADQWGIDPIGNENLAKRGFSFLEGLSFVRDVAHASGGFRQAVPNVTSMLVDGRRAVLRGGWSLHISVEGDGDTEIQLKTDRVRRIARPSALKELPGTIPQVTRAKPFRPIKQLLGPEGQNWLPVHGIFPLSRAVEISAITEEYFVRHFEKLEQHDITVSYLTGTVGTAFTIEPMFFWVDRLHAFHKRHATDDQKQAYADTPANDAARETVMTLRSDLAGLWDTFGAAHFQMGRFYNYGNSLSSAARAMVDAIKAAVDPKGLMNPGALQLDRPAESKSRKSQFAEFPHDLTKDTRNVI